ncbi:MAG: hypothetical protein WAT91_10420 [Saprospiraceae bacterium]
MGIILTAQLFSCDPGHAVILQNNSNKEIKIKILNKPPLTPEYKSVIFIEDSITTNFDQDAKMIEITMDSLEYTREFNLLPSQSAMFDYGISDLDLKQKVVIDEKDTLGFKNKNRLETGENFMSKIYVFSVISKGNKYE